EPTPKLSAKRVICPSTPLHGCFLFGSLKPQRFALSGRAPEVLLAGAPVGDIRTTIGLDVRPLLLCRGTVVSARVRPDPLAGLHAFGIGIVTHLWVSALPLAAEHTGTAARAPLRTRRCPRIRGRHRHRRGCNHQSKCETHVGHGVASLRNEFDRTSAK